MLMFRIISILSCYFLAWAGLAWADDVGSSQAIEKAPETVDTKSACNVAAEICDQRASAKCPTECKTSAPLCGPRVRVIVPPPQVVFRQYCSTHQSAKPCHTATCVKHSCENHTGFGATSRGQTMITIQVPYTYMVPVPTYAVVPLSNGYGTASMIGGGSVPTAAFGSFAQFGGIQPAVALGGMNISNEALAKTIANLIPKKETAFGRTPEGDCKKEIADLNAKLETMRGELTEFYKLHKENDTKLKEAIIKLSERLVIVNDKLGETKDGKTLAATIAELDARITNLKKQNNLKD